MGPFGHSFGRRNDACDSVPQSNVGALFFFYYTCQDEFVFSHQTDTLIMNKKYTTITTITVIAFLAIVLVFVVIKTKPAFPESSVTAWTTYRSSACGISYAIPPDWVSQGWTADGVVIGLSSPDDIRKDETNTETVDTGAPMPPISFYANCADDAGSVFDGQDEALIENGTTVEAALAKGQLKSLKNARYLKTLEVAGQKAFLYEIGSTDSNPGMQYDSIFVYVKNRWMEIRPSMTRFSDITQDQRGILDSIQITDVN